MEQASESFKIINRLGLHARAAAKLVTVASRFPCEVVISKDGQSANAKSVMGVLLLCGAQGTVLQVSATGDSAMKAVAEIGVLIRERFGESD